KIVRRRFTDGWFKEPGNVVAKIPDRTARKAGFGECGRGNKREAAHERFELVQGIVCCLKFTGGALLYDPDGAPTAFEGDPRLPADKGVAPGLLTFLHRLEQERVATVVDLLEGGDRHLNVGDEFRVNGNQVPALGELAEFRERR